MLGYGEPKLEIPQPTQDPSKMKDVDYCAEQITFTLQQALDYADHDYFRNYERMRALGTEVPKKEWRRLPAKVWCLPDSSFDGYIDCFLAMLDFDNKQHSAHIGRFFVISSADKEIDGGFYRTHWDQLVQGLMTYSLGKLGSDRAVCIRDIFDSRPYPLQILSPYHQNKSTFDFLVLHGDGRSQKFYAILVPTLFVGRGMESIDLFESLIDNNTLIFNRLMMDPTEPYPPSCAAKPNVKSLLPVVDPKPSEEPRDNLGAHFVDIQQALREIYGRSYSASRQWSCPHAFANNQMMNGAIVDEVLSVLSTAAFDVAGTELIDCSHPLPVITGSAKCPKTKAVIGSTMFNRLLYRPGLWIAVRGQNRVEARASGYSRTDVSGYGASPSYSTQSYLPLAVTTDDFYSFDITDNPGLSYHKLHLFKASKGLFLIVIWEENVSIVTAKVPQLPVLEPAHYKPQDRDLTFRRNHQRAEFQQIYPNIYPLITSDDTQREQDAVRRYRAEMRKLEDSSIPRPSAPPESPIGPELKEAPVAESKKPSKEAKRYFSSDDDFIDLGTIEALQVPNHPVLPLPVLNLDIPSQQPGAQPTQTQEKQKETKTKKQAVSLL